MFGLFKSQIDNRNSNVSSKLSNLTTSLKSWRKFNKKKKKEAKCRRNLHLPTKSTLEIYFINNVQVKIYLNHLINPCVFFQFSIYWSKNLLVSISCKIENKKTKQKKTLALLKHEQAKKIFTFQKIAIIKCMFHLIITSKSILFDFETR